MRKSIVVLLALLFSASMAWGAAGVWNGQYQTQDDGGFAAAGGPGAFHLAGATGEQGQIAIGAASPGDIAADSQLNSQFQSDSISDAAGPNFAGSGWTTEQTQEGGGIVSGGVYGYGGSQEIVGGSAGLTVGGQLGVAGSAGFAEAQGGSFVLGAGAVGQEQTQEFNGVYEQQSVSANGGYVYQTGEQTFGTEQSSGALLVGAAGSEASVAQFGGTAAVNSGDGTAMAGSGFAAGDASASAGAAGLAGASSSAFGEQTHTYEQFSQSADGSSQQFQTGTVFTQVNASASD